MNKKSETKSAAANPADEQKFQRLADFYPYYLSEHRDVRSRVLHYIGSLSALSLLIYILFTASWTWLPLVLVVGYGCAWVGHFFIEKNRPATFSYPFYSLACDWIMLKDACLGTLRGKIPK
ncbi:MAG: DUF962 domain-containing protein [Oleibacter sp.]|nr:DUF962 domain-containing protein [Thalassolituus sp.]